MIYQESLREGQVVAVWAGDLKDEDSIVEYLGQPFEKDFGFLLDQDDLPEYAQAKFGRADIGKLLKTIPSSGDWVDAATRLCRERGFRAAKTIVVFHNLRYQPELQSESPAPSESSRLSRLLRWVGLGVESDGRLHFVGNVPWSDGKQSWEELQSRRMIMPPFPKLVVNRIENEVECEGEHHDITMVSWTGTVRLESWIGFASREALAGEFMAFRFGAGPDGDFLLDVSPPEENNSSRPSEAQAKAFQHLLENQAAIRQVVLEGIFKVYPEWRESFFGEQISGDGGKTYQSGSDLPDSYPPENMPDIKGAEDLTRLIRLSTVHVLAKEAGGYARIGFSFDCTWDEEHGLGVLTHKGKVIDVGQADASFNDV